MGGVGSTIGKAVSGLTGADAAADAYGNAANAQLSQQQQDRASAVKYAVSDEELQQLQQSISLNNQDIARKQKLLASADPALIEAGNQALQLMQGKSAASLKPLQDQRAQQRQQLQQTLASQLGPDYASSSQGRAALNQFDQQTSAVLTGAQQQAIGQYMGYANNAEQFGNLSQNMQQQNNIAGMYGNQSARRMSAITGTTVNPGLQYAGQQFLANQNMNNMGALFAMAGAKGFGKTSGGFGGGGSEIAGAGNPSMMAGGSDAAAMEAAPMMVANKGGMVPDRIMTLKDVTPKPKKKGK